MKYYSLFLAAVLVAEGVQELKISLPTPKEDKCIRMVLEWDCKGMPGCVQPTLFDAIAMCSEVEVSQAGES